MVAESGVGRNTHSLTHSHTHTQNTSTCNPHVTRANAAFMQMLRRESVARIPEFAGQRVRQASVVVKVVVASTIFLPMLHRQ